MAQGQDLVALARAAREEILAQVTKHGLAMKHAEVRHVPEAFAGRRIERPTKKTRLQAASEARSARVRQWMDSGDQYVPHAEWPDPGQAPVVAKGLLKSWDLV